MRVFSITIFICFAGLPLFADPLPSWNNTDAKKDVIAFVEEVTDADSDGFVPRADRIAVFDNDGTLWAEQPFYFQSIFAIDRLQELAERDPSILTNDTLKAAAAGDYAQAFAGGVEAMFDIMEASHVGMDVPEFEADVRDWVSTARNPATDMHYVDMVYQPMLDLLRYLRDEGFQTWIVSGSGIHFLRAFGPDVYNIPPQQIVGSTGVTTYKNGEIVKDKGLAFIDDKEGKPVGIDTHIGKRPIFAVGNSDGDFEMLEYVTSGDGPRFGMLIHHTDGVREFKYDREGPIGKLDRGLDEGPSRGWLIVDMAEDWGRVWPE